MSTSSLVTIRVDTSEIDSAISKARKLNDELEKAAARINPLPRARYAIPRFYHYCWFALVILAAIAGGIFGAKVF